MKKFIISTLPLRAMTKRVYSVERNALIEVKEPIYFAVNGAVSTSLKKDDDVKVILLETKGGENVGTENAMKFIDELNSFNKCGANINKEIIPTPFDESKNNFHALFKTMIESLEPDAEIYADITFGPRPLALLIFSVISFAEKNFNCSVGNIVYSKVEYGKDNKIKDGSEMIYDVTPLYLLNSFINTVDSSSGENAIKAIETLFED